MASAEVATRMIRDIEGWILGERSVGWHQNEGLHIDQLFPDRNAWRQPEKLFDLVQRAVSIAAKSREKIHLYMQFGILETQFEGFRGDQSSTLSLGPLLKHATWPPLLYATSDEAKALGFHGDVVAGLEMDGLPAKHVIRIRSVAHEDDVAVELHIMVEVLQTK